MSVINSSALMMGDDGYTISRSVRLRSSASAYFNRTPASDSNRKTWTWSGWAKRGKLGAYQTLFSADTNTGAGANSTYIWFTNTDTLGFAISGGTYYLNSTAVYRDPSAWYHIVAVYDTTQATSSNRLKLYVNGAQITAFGTATYPTLDYVTYVNTTWPHTIGARVYQSPTIDNYFDGYLTEINFIDGQALTPSSFGETDAVTGVWKPKKYGGTYGTNGFYLNFSDNSNNTAATIGKDYSGNGNNWTPNNISVTSGVTYDSMLDVPTLWADGGNGRGNYAVLNPLLYMGSGSTKSNGNLRFAGGGTGGPPYNYSIYGTFVLNAGKWYWETTITTAGSQPFVGMFNTAINFNGGSLQSSAGPVLYGYDGKYYNETTGVTFGNTYTTGDVIGIAVDFDNNLIWFSKNGTWQNSGDPSTGTNGKSFGSGKTWAVGYVESGSSTSASTFDLTFGQRPFAYTPPSGFKALNTQNLPTPTIVNGATVMAATLYTGNGTSQSINNAVNGVSFQPDFVWFKSRNNAASHVVFDSVRGANQGLYPNLTLAEGTWSGQSFLSNGFTVNATYSGEDNTNGNTMVGWQWKKGATPGFDIVTYTGNGTAGRTISHSLGVAPKMIIAKNRSNGTPGWPVYHASVGNTGALALNSTIATDVSSAYWNNTSPTSSVWSVGSGTSVNTNAENYVAYLFAEVAGYSKFGSVSANGASDNAFVYTGFLPRYVLLKRTDSTSNWIVWDTARNTYNVLGAELYPNLSNAESTVTDLDILSNGFKLRNSSFTGTWIFAAFASTPFKYSLGF